MQLILKLVFGLATLYAVVAVAAFLFQRRLTYFPDPQRIAPASFNLPGVEERVIATPDGEQLVAWFAPAAPGRPTVLYFHGNAGNLGNRSERVRRFLARGWGVMFLSYRGYGGSTGSAQRARQRRRCQARLRGAAQGRRRARKTSSSTGSRWVRASPCRWRRRRRSAASCSMRPIRRSSTWRRYRIRICRCGRSCSIATRRCASCRR